LRKIIEIIEGKESGRKLSAHMLLLRKMVQISDDDTKNEIYRTFAEDIFSSNTLPKYFGDLRDHWYQSRKDQRVLCVTTRWDSTSMWDRYASEHTGAVFELRCADEIDSSLIDAREIHYSDEPMKISTIDGFVDYMLHDHQESMSHMMDQNTLTKTTDWRNEEEWRVVSWKRKIENSGDFSDYSIHPNEAKAIILGISMKPKDRTEISRIAKNRFPNIEIWEAIRGSGRKLERRKIA